MQVEEIVRVSSKGQIVIPKRVRQKFGIEPGKKLLVATGSGKILLSTLEDLSLAEISGRTSTIVENEGIDVPRLVDEAVSWARKEKKKKKKQRKRSK